MLWMPLELLTDSLDGGDLDFDNDLDRYDLNDDGTISARDCPFPAGTSEAKLWWNNIMEPYVQSQITPEMQAKYGDSVVGAYRGAPLVPGEAGAGQGDFQFLVDKIKVTQGLAHSSAVKIAGKVKFLKYGQ